MKNIFAHGFIIGFGIAFGLITILQKRDTSFRNLMKIVDTIVPSDFDISDYLNSPVVSGERGGEENGIGK